MMRRTVMAGLALGFSLVIGAGLSEGVLRVYTAVNPRSPLRGVDPMGIQIEPHGTLGYRQRPNAVFHYFNGTSASSNSLGYRGLEVPIEPTPGGTIRVILFGGSTSHGWGVADDSTIDAQMRRQLHERFPTTRFDVVNLAFDGYDSYQDLQRLQSDGLRMRPSIVILNTGINDVRNAWYPNLGDPDPRTLIWEHDLQRLRDEDARGGPRMWTRVKHWLLLARIPGYLKDQALRRQEARQHAAAAAQASASQGSATFGGANRPPYPDAADYFERNVDRMVALSIAQGAAVLLSTPPSALRDFPDTATSQQSYWVYNARTTQAYRDELSRRMVKIESRERGQGHRVRYVAPSLPKALFLDDCHLTGSGNRVVAAAFIDAITPFLPRARER
jgi:lysophospholipase L1-like esterase